jgi:glycosyltransferase involved in cell wall biosynthesis
VYNAEEKLSETLEALLGQSYGDFELIISDNASTDSTADICQRYGKQDSRIRYIRQPRNIGRVPNHNFLVGQARGELFKWVAGDDLYARDLLKRCVAVLDENPQVVLAHAWEGVIDESGAVISLVEYPVRSDAPRAPDRFRSMLLDGWGDDSYGIVRTEVLRRTPLHGSYHLADRTFTTELALHGPFYQVPDWLYFRRDAPVMTSTIRERCAYMDPDRVNRWRYPVARLYGEYAWAYIAMIRRAPLTAAERQECYGHLARWAAGRALPVAHRALTRAKMGNRPPDNAKPADLPAISIAALVAGQEEKAP